MLKNVIQPGFTGKVEKSMRTVFKAQKWRRITFS